MTFTTSRLANVAAWLVFFAVFWDQTIEEEPPSRKYKTRRLELDTPQKESDSTWTLTLLVCTLKLTYTAWLFRCLSKLSTRSWREAAVPTSPGWCGAWLSISARCVLNLSFSSCVTRGCFAQPQLTVYLGGITLILECFLVSSIKKAPDKRKKKNRLLCYSLLPWRGIWV